MLLDGLASVLAEDLLVGGDVRGLPDAEEVAQSDHKQVTSHGDGVSEHIDLRAIDFTPVDGDLGEVQGNKGVWWK